MDILKDFEEGRAAWIELRDDDEQSLSSLDCSSIMSAEDSSDDEEEGFVVNVESKFVRSKYDGMHSLPNLSLEDASESSEPSQGLCKHFMASSSTKKSNESGTTLRSRWNDVMDSSLLNDQWSLKAQARPKQVVRLHDIRRESGTRAELEDAFQAILRAKSPINITDNDKLPVSPLRKASAHNSKLVVVDDKSPETTMRHASITKASSRQGINTPPFAASKGPARTRVIRCRTAEVSPFPSNPRSNKRHAALRRAHTVFDEAPVRVFRRSTKTIDDSATEGAKARRRSSTKSCGAEAEGGGRRRTSLRVHLVKKDSCPSLVYRTRSGQDDKLSPGRNQKVDSCPSMVQRRISGEGVEMEEQMGVRKRRGNRRRNFQKMDSCPQLVERKHSHHSKELSRDITKLTKPRAMKTKRSCEMLSNRQQEDGTMPDLMKISEYGRRDYQNRSKNVCHARKGASYAVGQKHQERNMLRYQERNMHRNVDLMGSESERTDTGMIDASEISRSIRGRTITFVRREMASASERSTNHDMMASGHTMASSMSELDMMASEHAFSSRRLEDSAMFRNPDIMLADSKRNSLKVRRKSDNMLSCARRTSLQERDMLRNPDLMISDRLEEREMLRNPEFSESGSSRTMASEMPKALEQVTAEAEKVVVTSAVEEKPLLNTQEKKNIFSSITDDTLSILRAGALGQRLPISNEAA